MQVFRLIFGLTLECCRCHDHKYDPISQKDYYGLFAYFNTLEDNGLDGIALARRSRRGVLILFDRDQLLDFRFL